MKIIILDINEKNKLLLKKEKKEVLKYASLITTGSNIEIIDSIDKYDQKLTEMYKINYPIYKKINGSELSIPQLLMDIDFENGDTIILPYFNHTQYWVKVTIGNKGEFLKRIYDKVFFNSFSIICLSTKRIFDIELGEQEYEIRLSDC